MVFYDPNQNDDSPRLFIYALSTCGHCRHVKKLLDELDCPYDHVDVDQLPGAQMDEALEEMSKYNPAETFPTTVFGSKVIVGFREDDLRQVADKVKAAS